MRIKLAAFAMLIGLVATAVVLYVNRQNTTAPQANQVPVKTPDRRPILKQQLAEQERASALDLAEYHPTNKTQLADLGSPVVDLLRQLPGVIEVEISVASEKPQCRIVHLRDWHSVPKEHYAIDMKSSQGRELTDDEVDRLHQELLLEIESVQLEQMALLRCLIRQHGLKLVFSEGLTRKGYPNFIEIMGVLKHMEKDQIGPLRKELVGLRQRITTMDPKSESYVEAKKIEEGMADLINQHDLRLLEFGAAARLLVAGEIEEILPLDDAEVLDMANPVTPNGVMADAEKRKAREDAQVKAVLERGGLALIVLGGSHDLSDSVRRLGQGRCEYMRVTTRRYKEFAE
jgi:hypothetical protein